MKKLLAALAAIIGLLVILPSPAIAITDGTPDTGNRYPFVGLLAFRDADGEYMHRCSGTLLTERIVLTASHCTDGTSVVHAYFSFQVPDDFRENPVGVLGTPHTNPLYNPNTLDNDASVVVLSSPISLGTYPVLPHEGLLSELKAAHEIQDDVFVNVGYGVLNGSPPPILVDNEDRWYSTSPYGGLTQNNLHLQGNHRATGQGGTCFGDSGGPHFWEDSLILVSVTSWGDAICHSLDMTQRTDIPSVLDWLREEFGVVPPA
jgi:secreted trypsin-like serine protease